MSYSAVSRSRSTLTGRTGCQAAAQHVRLFRREGPGGQGGGDRGFPGQGDRFAADVGRCRHPGSDWTAWASLLILPRVTSWLASRPVAPVMDCSIASGDAEAFPGGQAGVAQFAAGAAGQCPRRRRF